MGRPLERTATASAGSVSIIDCLTPVSLLEVSGILPKQVCSLCHRPSFSFAVHLIPQAGENSWLTFSISPAHLESTANGLTEFIGGIQAGYNFQAGHVPSRRKGTFLPALRIQCITASASNPANSSRPASRLDLNIRRHSAGSPMSNRLICQARCAANVINPIQAGQRTPPSISAAPISTTASE